MSLVLLCIFAFLFGSIPFGAVFSRLKGIDLKTVGSGNIGATNVLRSVGKLPAFFTLLCDILKGLVPVLAAQAIIPGAVAGGVVGIAAVMGHDFSIFLRFRGGKGVATSIGVLMAYAPFVGLVTVVLWLAVVALTRYSSLGALVAFSLLPLSMFVIDPAGEKVLIAFVMTALLIAKHTANIQRLLKGTESRVGKKV